MSDLSADPRVNPHSVPWLFKLMTIFQRPAHPVAWDVDPDALSTETDADSFADILKLASDRRRRMEIFEEMDTFGLVSSILDIFAEESTQIDYDKGRRVWVESGNSDIIRAAKEVFENCMVEERIPAVVRRMYKFGDSFQRLVYQTGKGVLGWRNAQPKDINRWEDKYGRLIGFSEKNTSGKSKKFRGKGREESWPWDYIHFRILGRDESELYGTSHLQAMFRPWRQLALAEDATLSFRLRRAPDRNVIFFDKAGLDPVEAARQLNLMRKRFRKHEYIDPASPDYKKQFNPMQPMEDIFLPTKDGDNTRVETLAGSGSVGEVYDMEHFRDAFFGAARVPKAYFGFEGDINAKATLMQQDVRFARGVKRGQASALRGIRALVDTHLILLEQPGKASQFEDDYLVKMSPISYLDEFERLELMRLRFEIVQQMNSMAAEMQIDARVWAIYLLTNFAKLPEEVVLKLVKKTPEDAALIGGGEPPIAAGGGEEFEALSPEQKKQILDADHKAWLGTTNFSLKEAQECARMVHASPGLRRSLSLFAEYHSDDDADSMLFEQQVDRTRLPPVGVVVQDDYEDDDKAKTLIEDRAEASVEWGKLEEQQRLEEERQNEDNDDDSQDS